MPLIQLTQMCTGSECGCSTRSCKPSTASHGTKSSSGSCSSKPSSGSHSSKPSSGSCKSKLGSSPCSSNSSSSPCMSDSSSRSHTGWSKYTCPTTTTTGPHTTGPCWYCSAHSPDNLSKLDREETRILR